MNTAIAKTQQTPKGGLSLVDNDRNELTKLSMRDLKELAGILHESGSFPDLKTAAQAMVKVLAGQELGFSPIVSVTGIHFFQGKVEFSATLKASLIKGSGRYDYRITKHTDQICEIEFFQKVGNEWTSCGVPVSYTFADATKAGLTSKDVWKKHPKDMLFAACIRQGQRRYCADVLRGMGADQDIDDVETAAPGQLPETSASVIETVAGEHVDTSTGEVIDGEAVVDEERAAIENEPAGDSLFDGADSSLVDLRTAAADRYNELKGSAREAANKWLGQATIGTLDADGLKRFLKEADSF